MAGWAGLEQVARSRPGGAGVAHIHPARHPISRLSIMRRAGLSGVVLFFGQLANERAARYRAAPPAMLRGES